MIQPISIYTVAFLAGLRPDPRLSVVEWADTYRILPKKAAAEPGQYRSSRTPYVREIMDCLSPHNPVQEICVIKATQIGMTEVGNCWFGYVVDVCPGPMMMVFPTVELAKDHSKQKLAPTIEETPRLAAKVKENRTRDSGNTIMVKEFPGGILFLTGSNSGAGFRSKSLRYLFLDDIDGYEADVAGEGDPIELARKRTDSYSSRKKIFEVSTPTTSGISHIERAYKASDQRSYEVPCPFCGGYQKLEWGGVGCDYGIKFERDEEKQVVDVWYECQHCHKKINEHEKTKMLEAGKWIPKYSSRNKRGYHLSSLYSPLGWVSWKQVADEFLQAKDNKERLKVWTNTRLAEPFEEIGDQPDWVSLSVRCEPYPVLTVPGEGLFLTAGVDVQDNRLAVAIRAWGRGEESWLIWWGEIYGDPGQSEVWQQLDEMRLRAYPHVSGAELYILSMAVDSGGHHTQDVYNYCRGKSPTVIAIKGASRAGQPIVGRPSSQDVTWGGKKIEKGVQLWPIGSDTAKSMIYSRLKQTEPGPGTYHWPIGIEENYFRQLCAEKLVTRYVKGYPKLEWIKIERRNEGLDVEVYALAAALRAGMARMNWDALAYNFTEKTAVDNIVAVKRHKVARSKFMS